MLLRSTKELRLRTAAPTLPPPQSVGERATNKEVGLGSESLTKARREVGLGSESPTKERRVRFAVDMPTEEPTRQ